MANVVASASGSTTTYTITDNAGSTLAIAVTSGAVTGNTTVFTSSGGLGNDGITLLAQLALQLGTGLLPGNGAQGITNI